MRKFLQSILLSGLLLSVGSSLSAQELYVKTNGSVFKLPFWIESVSKINPQSSLKKTTNQQLIRVKLNGNISVREAIEQLELSDGIFWAEEVISYSTPELPIESLVQKNNSETQAVPNDPDRSSLQPWLETLQASTVWDSGTGSSDIVIAIIDTGVDYNHEDLSANHFINPNEIPNNQIDDDNNGFVDDVNGWDFYDSTGNPLPKGSTNNHGTHVAGLAAAVTNNGIGISALSYNVKFMPIKVSDNNGKNLRYAVESIYYAVDNGADIINCSWGSTRYSKALNEAVNYAWEHGVLITAAAGNDGNASVYYPAGYARSIAVGSINYQDLKKSTFSNYGSFVDVFAPGGETTSGIYSTLPNNQYGTSFGTSMASPLVASALGILKSIKQDWDIATVRTQLQTSSSSMHTLNPSLVYQLGDGLIKPATALSNDLKARFLVLNHHFGDPENVTTVFNRNEEFNVFLDIENIGINQSSVKINAFSMSQNISVLSGNGASYQLNHLSETTSSPITFRVSSDAQVNTKAQIRFEFTYDDNSKSFHVIDVNLVPDNLVHSINTIELGVNGTGRIGYYNYPSNTLGSGFIVKQDGTTQNSLLNLPLLREAGLIMGTGTTRISSAVRSLNTSIDDEFFLIDYFESEFDATSGTQKGKAVFTDLNAGIESVRFDMQTTLQTYAQTNAEDAAYILLKYTLENQNQSETFSKFRAGVFFDFDMPFTNPNDDITFYDKTNDLIAQFSGGTESDTTLYVGASIVEGIYTPWIIDNNAVGSSLYFGISYSGSDSRQNGFTDQEKWLALDTRDAALLASRTRIGPANTSFVISPAAFSLSKGESGSFTLVLAQATGYQNLVSAIKRARERAPMVTPIEQIKIEKPQQLEITSIYPNPFNPSTTINYSLPTSSNIHISIFDMLGRKVHYSGEFQQTSGVHHYQWDASQFASGVYLVRVQSGTMIAVQKATLIK